MEWLQATAERSSDTSACLRKWIVIGVSLLAGCAEPGAVVDPDIAYDYRAPTGEPRLNALQLGVVDAGSAHSCGLAPGGKAYCWGANDWGQLGNNGAVATTVASPVATQLPYTDISAGVFTTCAVAPLGEAYCWGQLPATPFPGLSRKPRVVSGNVRFSSISVGGSHVCGVAVDATAYCWGSTVYGAIGNGSMVSVDTMPVPVAGNIAFASISAGYRHTCGVAIDGTGYCWGWGYRGRLGTWAGPGPGADTLSVAVPTPVVASFPFVSIEAGHSHTCGVTPAAEAYCWGSADSGKLGITSQPNDQFIPGQVAGGLALESITAGVHHTCALEVGGQAYCWGTVASPRGPLALGPIPTPLTVGQTHYQMISATHHGTGHICGVGANGFAYCWGYNEKGQLGNGTTTVSSTPSLVKLF